MSAEIARDHASASRLRIRLTRLTDQRHAFEIERGAYRERVELETRSTLHHDLTHLAVEEAAGLEHGFFGALAAGKSLAELRPPRGEGTAGEGQPVVAPTGATDRMLEVERMVVVLQPLARADADQDPAALHARIAESLALQQAVPPPWFTVELVRAVRERLRRLMGRWRATPFGQSMELLWRGD